MHSNLEPLIRDDCALLLIDYQKTFLDLCVDPFSVTENSIGLIEMARILDIPILFTVHNPDKMGGVMPELIDRVPGARPISKITFNCFETGAIAEAIGKTGRKTLLMAGLEAHICLMHTGLGALRLGYRVHVAADAATSRSALNRDLGLQRLGRAGAVISSTEMMLFELLNRVATPEFRAALPLIKRLQDLKP